MNVSLTPQLEALVKQKVATGLYNSASEVIREALRLLDEHDHLRQLRHEALRKEIAVGIEEADHGELIPGDEVFRGLRERAKGKSPEPR